MPKSEPKTPPGMRKIGDMYYAWVQVRGKRLRKKLSENLAIAKGMLADELAGLHRGHRRAAAAPRWDDVSARWLKSLEGTPGFVAYRYDLERFNEFLKANGRISRIDELTHRLMEDFVAWRKNNRLRGSGPIAPRTINRTLQSIQQVCNWAVDGQELDRSPVAKLKMVPTGNKRKRRSLTPDEIKRLLAAAPPHMDGLLRFMLTTGCRIGEVITLTWEKVDFDRGEVTITADIAKNGRERRIPLCPGTLEVLKRLRDAAPARQPDAKRGKHGARLRERFSRDHVFVSSANTAWSQRTGVADAFYTVCKVAAIEGACRGGNIDLHALRVTFATTSLDRKADLLAVSEILGHHSPAFTLEVYDRTLPASHSHAVSTVDLNPAARPAEPAGESGKGMAKKRKRKT